VTPAITIDPTEFVDRVKPLLETQDLHGLTQLLRSRWTSEQIVAVLSVGNCEARKVASLALSLVGCRKCVEQVVGQLKDPDAMTNQMAEHALWAIWFRCGNSAANAHIAKGSRALSLRHFDQAEEHFTDAIRADSTFAEAYNQRAIVKYLTEHYEESIVDCRKATELMPCHFGAWAGMGHCFAHLGKLRRAIRCYRKALQINPHLECLTEAIEALGQHGDAE
jgi:tetratricopeptide (TPR) repeat protein